MTAYVDTGKTILAAVAGDAVGKVVPTKGTLEATQATTASKPTLARHPKRGSRQLQARSDPRGIPAGVYSQTYNIGAGLTLRPTDLPARGVTTEVVATGAVDGRPFIRVRFNGTVSAGSAVAFYLRNEQPYPIPKLSSVVMNADFRYVSGSYTGGITIYTGTQLRASGVYSKASSGAALAAPQSGSEIHNRQHNYTLVGDEDELLASGATVAFAGGTVVNNYTIDVFATQIEFGSTPTPYQNALSLNDVVEGDDFVWHLYNDGGDSLMITPPAGVYDIYWVNSVGVIESTLGVTFDGSTPTNLARATSSRTADYYIGPPLTPKQKADLEKYWKGLYL